MDTRFKKGQLSWNKGKGMTEIEKKIKRVQVLKKYNNKPSRKKAVKMWHLAHKERVMSIKSKYANTERGKRIRRENSQRRIEREKGLKHSINWEYFEWLCTAMKCFCIGCGKYYDRDKITVDHWIPINCGGDNQEWNLQPLCKSCNCRKQDRMFYIDNWVIDYLYATWLLKQSTTKHIVIPTT